MKVLSAPHRPFFLLGVINTLLSMLVFILSWHQMIHCEVTLVTFHPFLMIYTLFPFFIFGFLFTIFPRFLGTEEIKTYRLPVAFSCLSLLFIYCGILFSPFLYSMGIVGLLVTYLTIFKILVTTYLSSYLKDKTDTFHILAILCGGIAGLITYLVGFLINNEVIISFSFWIGSHLYLILLFFTILQRMIPFFSTSIEGYISIRPRNIVPFLLIGMILDKCGDLYDWYLLSSFGLLTQGVAIFYLLTQWKLPYQKAPAILMVLYSGILWFLYASLFGAIYEVLHSFQLRHLPPLALNHGLYIGFIATIMIGFVSRVTRGHGGEKIVADKVTKIVFALLSILSLLRICSDIFLDEPSTYITAISWLLVLWIVGFLMWGIKYSRWLLR
jgi:uncharacterized protein involved in response to NO